ncbi:MAG: efflux transporter outer membrane subunit [Pelovirga sp.]
MRNLIVLTTTLLLLGGCTLGPDYQRQELDLPEHWPAAVATAPGRAAETRWWQEFDDPFLNRLVERALDDNLNLQLQLQRIADARAQLGLQTANRWPLLSAQAEASRQRQSTAFSTPGNNPYNSFSLAAVLSYEVDLWGRIERQREAAEASLAASVHGTEAVRLALVTDLVTGYINLRSIAQQQDVLNQTVRSRQQTLDLEILRQEQGANNPLSLRQAEAALEASRARLPQLEQQFQLYASALAVLAGFSPRELLAEFDFGARRLEDLTLPAALPDTLPSELLQRRPDLQAAEAALIAANARVGVAMAERWPSLNLHGLIGSAAPEVDDLFSGSSRIWTLAGGLAGPLFDFGRSRARIESAQALLEQAQTTYELAVVGAFRDVRDALTLHQGAEQRMQALQRQRQAVARAGELAAFQYEYGAIGFYELLAIQRDLLDTDLLVTDALRDQLIARATLFKALGGNF